MFSAPRTIAIAESRNQFRSAFSRIYELEKKHIKEEDRLKKDMMAKLESVASEFRKASHAQMSATTQRTIRENVVTQSEVSSFYMRFCDISRNLSSTFSFDSQVNQLSQKVSELSKENSALAAKNSDNKMKIALLEQEENKLVKRNAYRLKVIEQLSERCHMQEGELARLNSFYGERRKYEARIARLEAEIDELHKGQNLNDVKIRI